MSSDRSVTLNDLDARDRVLLRHLDTRCNAIDARLVEVIQIQQQSLKSVSEIQVAATRVDMRLMSAEKDILKLDAAETNAGNGRRRITAWDVTLVFSAVGLVIGTLKFLGMLK